METGITYNKCKVKAYEGDKPYIFISYAHKESDVVFPIIEHLTDKGYRIWYDDGISPGSEWPEYIASHLNGCEVCLAFISEASTNSPNCRKEINFALSKNKSLIGVFLEKTELSLGLELQISTHQCVMKYEYADETEFYSKLMTSVELAACRDESATTVSKFLDKINSEDVMMGGIEPKKRDYGVVIKSQPANQSADQPEVKTSEKSVEKKEAKLEVKKPKERKQKEKKQTKNPKKPINVLRLISITIGSLVAVVAIIVVAVLSATKKYYIGNEEVSKNATYITLDYATLDDESIKNIGKLKRLENLTFRNCDLGGIDFGIIKNKDKITSVEIENCTGKGTTGYNFGAFENIRTFKVINSELTEEDLKNTFKDQSITAKINNINVSGNKEIKNFNGIPLQAIGELNISDTSITDVSPLLGNNMIMRLYMSGLNINNIEPVYELEELTELDISNCGIKDTNKKIKSIRLWRLNVSGNDITSAEAFDDLTILDSLNIANTKITSAPFIEKNTATLEKLDVSGTMLDEETLKSVAKCTHLKELYISGIKIDESLNLVKDMKNLETLFANGCGIKSFDPIEGMNNLATLSLKDNEIESIAPLNALQKKAVVDLRNNNISSLSELKDVYIKFLALNGNKISINRSDFAGAPAIDSLVIDYTDDLISDDMKDIIGGKKPGIYNICVVDIPTDKIVAFDDAVYRSYRSHADKDQVEKYMNDGFSPDNWTFYWCAANVGN